MPLKDVLVYVSDCDDPAREATKAIAFAHAHGAHLSGLHLMPLEKMSGLRKNQSQQPETDCAKTASRVFKAAASKAGVSADWITAGGDFSSPAGIAKAFNHHARLADLIILRQPVEVGAGLHHGQILESVILGSGRPVLILPDSADADLFGTRVLIAWDHSKEAARAVHDALPLLRKAETIEVLTVGLVAASPTGTDVPGKALCEHLGRHGIVAAAAKIRALESTIGESLMATAESKNADLIVLGAYGHSSSGELLLDDVTGTILENTKTALFLSH